MKILPFDEALSADDWLELRCCWERFVCCCPCCCACCLKASALSGNLMPRRERMNRRPWWSSAHATKNRPMKNAKRQPKNVPIYYWIEMTKWIFLVICNYCAISVIAYLGHKERLKRIAQSGVTELRHKLLALFLRLLWQLQEQGNHSVLCCPSRWSFETSKRTSALR